MRREDQVKRLEAMDSLFERLPRGLAFIDLKLALLNEARRMTEEPKWWQEMVVSEDGESGEKEVVAAQNGDGGGGVEGVEMGKMGTMWRGWSRGDFRPYQSKTGI